MIRPDPAIVAEILRDDDIITYLERRLQYVDPNTGAITTTRAAHDHLATVTAELVCRLRETDALFAHLASDRGAAHPKKGR